MLYLQLNAYLRRRERNLGVTHGSHLIGVSYNAELPTGSPKPKVLKSNFSYCFDYFVASPE